MRDISELRTVFKEAIDEQLAPTEIDDLQVESDVDHDGDPILRLLIVFDMKDGLPDAEKVNSFNVRLFEILREDDDDRYPVMTFMSLEERDAESA